ncbi:2-dehydropantoate 2-reductase [Euryarchaeota archaeon ex4484_178]|nr:MAG: 2-dehydropantoate 2-reductase [Euryarchaeota archaeon ex4484_178]
MKKIRIAVFGAGSLGSVIGALLSKKNDVLLITRGEHLLAIRERGLELRGLTRGIFDLEAESYYPGGFDLIILTVKAYDTQKAAEDIKKEYGDESLITFQNGVGIVDMLRDFDVIPGVTSHGATMISPGVVKHAGYGDTFIGEKDGHLSERVFEIARNFTDCGLKTEVVNDIMERRWIKAAINACINPLAAVMNVPNGVLVEDEHLREIMRCIADECSRTLAEREINVDVYSLAVDVARKTEENICSMLQDIRRGKRTEIDFITAPFISGICNLTLYRMIKFLERRGEGDFEPVGEIHPPEQRGEGDSNPRGQ